MRRSGVVVAVGCALMCTMICAFGGSATAEEPRPSLQDEPRVRAKRLFNLGTDFYKDGDFVAAAVLYEEAQKSYALAARGADGQIVDPDALRLQGEALFFEGSAYSLANRPVEATAALVRYRDQFGEGLAADDRAQLDAALVKLEAAIGTVTLRGVPAGADVLIDNRVIADAGAGPLRLAVGDHLVDIRAAKYKPFLKTVAIKGGQDEPLDVALELNETPARVRVEASVDGARVEIDGVAVGPVPAELSLSPGVPHRYRVSAEAYVDQEGTIEVAPGERALIKVGLVVRRAPLGLRIEPFFLGTFYLRTDTPFGEANAGIGLHVFNNHWRYQNLRLGFAFEYQARDLDVIGVGGTATWCPDTTSGDLFTFCPANMDLHVVFGGHADPGFSAGSLDGRLGSSLELRVGNAFLRFAMGLGLVTYKSDVFTDQPDNQWLMTSHVELAAGLDL